MDYQEYIDWARQELNVDFASPSTIQRYDLNATQIKAQVEADSLIRSLPQVFSTASESYCKNSIRLFMNSDVQDRGPIWSVKSFKSVLNKSYRINYVNNPDFPSAPPCGWCDSDSLYHTMDDLIRTTIVTRYLSGADAVVASLREAAEKAAVPLRHSRRESEHGYYSQHIHLALPVILTDRNFIPNTSNIEVEIQVTTQLQDALYDLTHGFYEVRRLQRGQGDDPSWKWDVSSARFKASYAGHALHLLEGMFEELVDNERKREEQ